jgi:signal transduction histidine kinase
VISNGPASDANGEAGLPAIDDVTLQLGGVSLRSLFDRFPFAVEVYTPDGRPYYANPAHHTLWGAGAIDAGGGPLESLGLMPFVRRGLDGESVATPPTRLAAEAAPGHSDRRPRWLRSFVYPIRADDGVTRAVVVMQIDVTERIEAQRILEERVSERTREIATLLKVSQSVTSTLDLSMLLALVLEQLKVVADYSGSTVVIVEDGEFRILDDRGGLGPDQPNPELIGGRWPLATAGKLWETISRLEPVLIDDVRGEGELARDYRETNQAILETPAIRHVRSWLAVPLAVNDRAIGFISISKDEPGYYTSHHARLAMAIAAQAAAAIENARLFEQERRAAEELAALLRISQSVSSTLELEPLLGLILDQLKQVVEYMSAVVMTREAGDLLIAREYRGPLPREVVLSRRLKVGPMSILAQGADAGRPLIIPDIWDETPTARAYRAVMGEEYLRTTAPYLRCLLSAPLVHKGTVIGSLALGHQTPGFYTARHTALAQAIADQVAGAIQNARLYEQERRTAAEMASLVEVSRNLASTLELRPLLDVILSQIKVVADYEGAMVMLIEDGVLRTLIRRAPTVASEEQMHLGQVPLERLPAITETVLRRRPAIIGDVRGDEPLALAYREAMGGNLDETPQRYVRSWMGVPLTLKDRVIGMIALSHGHPNAYTPHHAELVSAIGAQAAAAIENARLFEQAHKLAALEERQRLARELHDSVSQVLFSIGLGARTVRTLLERGDPARAVPSVEYILNLAEMGMAEMRALLFELRPESLAQEGLVAAITKQVAALRARHGIDVTVDLCDEPDASIEQKEAMYRIAQEAMHNTVKHARAGRLDIRLAVERDGLLLGVRDDGQGFDPAASFPGHLGLRSMEERVERLGGTLTVESAPGSGTRIRAWIPTGG